MFFACGVSAYAAGIFHLLTHGFFKALLFLGAGSVIHAMSGEQDIRKMGGIWKKIPFTYVMMWIGSLALAGVFPFAGFYSKDGVLEAAMASGSVAGQNAYWVGLFVALLTALYSWRLIIKVFHGAPNASHEVMHHVHESPFSMTVPLGFLAIGSVLAGMFGVYILGIIDESHAVWGGAIMVLEHNNSIANIENIDHVYAYLPIISGISGIALAYFLYGGSPRFIQKIHKSCGSLYNFLLNKWYFDELYHIVFVRSSKRLGKVLWHMVDGLIIDGIPNGAAYITQGFSRFTSALQTGFIYHYAIAMMLGLLALLSWTILIL
jgi:NADH-quinone oxidoreductase subunit L